MHYHSQYRGQQPAHLLGLEGNLPSGLDGTLDDFCTQAPLKDTFVFFTRVFDFVPYIYIYIYATVFSSLPVTVGLSCEISRTPSGRANRLWQNRYHVNGILNIRRNNVTSIYKQLFLATTTNAHPCAIISFRSYQRYYAVIGWHNKVTVCFTCINCIYR